MLNAGESLVPKSADEVAAQSRPVENTAAASATTTASTAAAAAAA